MADATEPTFHNPDTVAPPLGAYSHVAILPAGAELIASSGQVGNTPTARPRRAGSPI